MKFSHLTTSILAAGFLLGCGQAAQVADKAVDTAKTTTSDAVSKTADVAKDTMSAAKDTVKATASATAKGKPSRQGVSIGEAPSGIYKSEQGHAYVAFTYLHQGYSKPILRWGVTNATVNLNSESPDDSTLSVEIPVSSIDSGVEAFDQHLVSADFFDAANHPTITFKSTSMKQVVLGSGNVSGDLTIKGVTKPVTLDVTLNKVGKNFRSGADMFGISATGNVKRSDFGVDKYGPMADDVEIMIEVEFIKEG